jgi:hypothetical protein
VKTILKLALALFVGLPVVVLAQDQPKLNCVKDVKYSQEFLAKFPDAGASCQDVKLMQGEKWVRFDAVVRSNKDSRMTVNVLNTQGNPTGNPLTFTYTPDATLTLKKKSVVRPAYSIKKGDKVLVWVPESRFGVYAEPGASESKHFTLVTQ